MFAAQSQALQAAPVIIEFLLLGFALDALLFGLGFATFLAVRVIRRSAGRPQ